MKKMKGVKFNDKHEDERKMLEWIKEKSFSGYIKRLIWADMEKENIPVNNAGVSPIVEEENNADFMGDLV